MNISPSDLMIFACIAEEESFWKAADKLDIPNSTLSRRIMRLESELGERLFTRTTRKVVMTEYGHAVLRHAQQIVSEVEATIAITENRRAIPSGQLRISMPADFTHDMAGKLLAGFIEQYPGITLDIDVSQRRVDIIGENFDVAIRMGKIEDDTTLVARRIGTFHIGLYAAPNYLNQYDIIKSPAQLMDHKMLILDTKNTIAGPVLLMQRGEDKWEGTPSSRANANSPSVLINMALCGAGITGLAEHFVRPWLESGQLIRVLDEWECPSIPVWAVFPGRRLMPTRTRVFIDSLVENFGSFLHKEKI